MEISIDRKALVDVLSTVSGVADKEGCFSSVLLIAREKCLKLVVWSPVLQIERIVQCDVVADGAVATNCRKLSGAISKMTGETVSISANEALLTVKSGRTRCKIPVDVESIVEEVVRAESSYTFTIGADTLVSAIQRLIPLCGTKSNLPFTNGIGFVAENGEITAYATDGCRAGLHKLGDIDHEFVAVVPQKTLEIVQKLFAENDHTLDVSIADGKIEFYTADTLVVSLLLETNYPSVSEFFDHGEIPEVKIPTKAFAQSVDVVDALHSDRGSAVVRMSLEDNCLTVESESTEGAGEAMSTIGVSYEGEKLIAVYQARFLRDYLKTVSDQEYVLWCKGPANQGFFYLDNNGEKNEDFVVLIMPVRVD